MSLLILIAVIVGYICAHAEYFAAMKDVPKDDIDVSAHRCKLAFLFYSYGISKQIYCYENEAEDNTSHGQTLTEHGKAVKAPMRKRKTRATI